MLDKHDEDAEQQDAPTDSAQSSSLLRS